MSPQSLPRGAQGHPRLPFRHPLGSDWPSLGPSWGHFGTPLARFGIPWVPPWPPEAAVDVPCPPPRATIGQPRTKSRHLGLTLAALWLPLASPWRTFGVILASRINGQVRKNKGSENIWALAPIGALRRSNQANTESTVI